MVLAVLAVANLRLLGVKVVETDGFGLEDDLPARVEPGGDEVLDDLVLAVHRDRTPSGELVHVDAVALPTEPQLDAVMDHTLLLHTVTDTRLVQQVDRVLLQHARPDPLLDVVAAADLEHDRLDALQVQKVREHKPRRSGPDDPDLCAHARCSSVTRCAARPDTATSPHRRATLPYLQAPI